ncbi:nucleolin-like isoform X4 [Hippocampus comes]|uniref:nucleolin-like isoform X4 n=1 Tax=Hippocampus comes TaxID=109280 RepID=UPI00094EB058|nr:PREDICTED: nucleolin-like isoform X4 [Hippocampus comes]
MDRLKAEGTTTQEIPSKVLENNADDTSATRKQRRKAESIGQTSPPKKTKLINDGYCVFVGNLNNSKTFEEVTQSLEKYFMTQSLLVQDIRLAKSRKHAFLDLASNMDVTKALSLDGAMILGQPLTIAKAKVKTVDSLKKKAKGPKPDKKAKDGRCLFLKNVPYNATRRDIREIFPKAIKIRFPDQADHPSRGIAFLEFKNEAVASKIRKRKQGAKIQDRLLIIDPVGVAHKSDEKNVDTKPTKKEESTKLIVRGLSSETTTEILRGAFEGCLSARVATDKVTGKSKRFGFVEYESKEMCTAAKEAMVDSEINGSKVIVCYARSNSKRGERAPGRLGVNKRALLKSFRTMMWSCRDALCR